MLTQGKFPFGSLAAVFAGMRLDIDSQMRNAKTSEQANKILKTGNGNGDQHEMALQG